MTKHSLYYIIDYMITVNALKARSQLGTMLDKVSQEGEHYVIERLNKPLVAVVPIDEYEEVFSQRKAHDQEKQKEEFLALLHQFRKKYGKRIAGKEGSTAFIRKMRQERTKQLLDAISRE